MVAPQADLARIPAGAGGAIAGGAAAGPGVLAGLQAWVMNPMNIASVALVLFQFFASKKAQKKAQREASTRTIQGRPTGAGQDVPVVYGWAGVPGLICYVNAGLNFPYRPAASPGTTLGNLAVQDPGDQDYEFVLSQSVLSAGACEGLVGLHVNRLPLTGPDAVSAVGNVQFHEFRNGNLVSDLDSDGNLKTGTPTTRGFSEMARAFAVLRNSTSWDEGDPIPTGDTGERTSLSRFTGLCYLTSAYEQLTKTSDKRQNFGNAAPETFALLKGRIVRSIVRSGAGTQSSPYTYEFSAVETFSSNWVRCLIDYLSSPLYGPGYPDGSFDLESCYAAQQAAEEVEQGSGSTRGGMAAPHIPAALATAIRSLLGLGAGATITNDHYLTYLERVRDSAAGSFSFNANPYAGVVTGLEVPASVRRYEFNGAIPTTLDYPDALQTFEQQAPGVDVFVDRRGKIKIRVPNDVEAEAEQVQLVIDQFVSEPKVNFPDANQRATQYTVRFQNWLKQASDDSFTFPSTGSVLHEQLKTRNGGLDFTDVIEAQGINNKWAASALAASRIFIDERPFVEFTVGIVGLLLEQGDIIRLKPPVSGLDLIVKVLNPPVTNPDWTHDVEAILFDKDDYGFLTTDHEEVEFTNIENAELSPPSALTASYSTDARELSVTVVPPSRTRTGILFYDLQVGELSAPGAEPSEWKPLATLLAGGTLIYSYAVPTAQRRVKFRAQSRGITEASTWLESSEIPFDGRLIAGAAGSITYYRTIPPGSCPPESLGKELDNIRDTVNGIDWQRSKPLEEVAQGDDGVVVRLDDVSFAWNAANKQWRASDIDHRIPDTDLENAPGYVRDLFLANDNATRSLLRLGSLSGTPPTWDSNNEPPAGDGVAGQENTAPGGQVWAKGTSLQADLINEDTGIIARKFGMAASDSDTVISYVAGGGRGDLRNEIQMFFILGAVTPSSALLPFADSYAAQAGTYLNQMRIDRDDGQVTLQFHSGNTPPYDQASLAARMSNDLVLAIRRNGGTWQTATFSGATYSVIGGERFLVDTPSDTGWAAWAAALPADNSGTYDIVFLDKQRRVTGDPANNLWYKTTASAEEFNPDLEGELILAFQKTADSIIEQAELGNDTSNPYEWTSETHLGTTQPLWSTAASPRTTAQLAADAVNAANGPVVGRGEDTALTRSAHPNMNQVRFIANGAQAAQIPNRYVEGGGTAYLRRFRIPVGTAGGVNSNFDMLLSVTTEGPGAAGPNLTAQARENLRFILHVDGVDDYVLKMPTGDTTEPYSFANNLVPQGLKDWAAAVYALAGTPAFTVTVYDNAINTAVPNRMMHRVWLVDKRIRCEHEVGSPWLPFRVGTGADGSGTERIVTVTKEDVAPTLPVDANRWAFDRPSPPWYDESSQLLNYNAENPYLWISIRRVTGNPASGAPRLDTWGNWSQPFRGPQWGQDGRPGAPGQSATTRVMQMNKRILVEPPPPTGINPTNPNEKGEYAWLQRTGPGAGTSTQIDIRNWNELFDRGPTPNQGPDPLTLRLARWDADDFDWLDYLKAVPLGGIIAWFPVVDASGNIDMSQWIDLEIRRIGLTNERFVEGGTFVGFHVIPHERDQGDMPAFPTANAVSRCAFGFPWAGPDAKAPTTAKETFYIYRPAGVTPPDPVKTAASFGDGNVPSNGWLLEKPVPSSTQAIWVATRTKTGSRDPTAWDKRIETPVAGAQYHRLYKLGLPNWVPVTPPDSMAWLAEEAAVDGWKRARPDPTQTMAVYRAQRTRIGNSGVPSGWGARLIAGPSSATPSPIDPRGTTSVALTASITIVGGWENHPTLSSYRVLNIIVTAAGGTSPYRNTGAMRWYASYSAGKTVQLVVLVIDANNRRVTVRLTSPPMP